jgi:predicted Fe-S protein YdhL (DUF1289 family)
MLAYAVGFGGSMIWFGSSAGVALSNLYPCEIGRVVDKARLACDRRLCCRFRRVANWSAGSRTQRKHVLSTMPQHEVRGNQQTLIPLIEAISTFAIAACSLRKSRRKIIGRGPRDSALPSTRAASADQKNARLAMWKHKPSRGSNTSNEVH